MQRRMLLAFDVAPDDLHAAAARALQVRPPADGEAPLDGRIELVPERPSDTTMRVELEIRPAAAPATGSIAELAATSTIDVPYFGWFARGLAALSARHELQDARDRLTTEVTGGEPPAPPRVRSLLPPVPFNPEQAARLASIAVVAAIANFCGALLTQNGDAVTESFHRTDAALGAALAVARTGVLISLVVAALADRVGRRRMLLICLVGACLSNAVAAAAPTFEVFTGAQVGTRAFVNAALVIGSIAAVEEAPEGARAFGFSLYALALGIGIGFSVLLLPLADLGNDGWRISFGLSALLVLLLPRVGATLRETQRFSRLAERSESRGRTWHGLRELFGRSYGARFLLLGLAAFLINVFAAPSSQLMNRYLRREHDFTNSGIGLFRGVTAGIPGIFGIILAGRLTETRGRRPVMVAGLITAALAQALFFLTGGWLLWIAPTIAIIATAFAGIAIGTLDTELFPTEVRGTSNGFLLVCGVAGSATGLLLATTLLRDAVGDLGSAIAVLAVAPLLAAVVIARRLPETARRRLDDVSPSEL